MLLSTLLQQNASYIPIYRDTNFRLSDCKGRALRKVQEKDSARVKGEAP